jgi:hypothetical protein
MQKDTDPEREGVVVRVDKSHIVVWNADDDLVVATGDEKIDEVMALVVGGSFALPII